GDDGRWAFPDLLASAGEIEQSQGTGFVKLEVIALVNLHKGLGRERLLLLFLIPICDRSGELGYQPDIRSGSLGRCARDRQKGGSHPQTNNSEQAQDSRLHLSFLHAEISLVGSSSSRL